ncbi:MAG: hypothetical protein RLZZ306_1639 [Bacteroidota bacterium]|jgi:hypothetical protein
MKKSLLLSLLAVAAITFSCKDDEVVVNADKIYQVSTTLSGANEVPAVVTSATGSTTGTYNQTTKILSVTTTYTGLTPTMGHIHTQTVPTNDFRSGGVTFGFPATGLASPIVFTSTITPLTAAQEANLFNGIMYVNIHTAANPGGEIRGNLSVR